MPTQLPNTDPLSYKQPQVAWTTIIRDVIMLSEFAYQLTIIVEDVNEPGAGDKEVGFFIKDFVGNTYKITAINVGGNNDIVEVEDVFKVGYGAQSGQPAIVYESVGDGTAPYLAPIKADKLDKSARDTIEATEKDIQWKGQKPIKLPFQSQDKPSVTNYYTDYFKYFGNEPNIELYTPDDDGKYVKRMEQPNDLKYVSRTVNGVTSDYLDEIHYDLANACDGYIKLSR